jgi:hypothetical protein
MRSRTKPDRENRCKNAHFLHSKNVHFPAKPHQHGVKERVVVNPEDAKDWENPYLIVRADGIEVVGAAGGGGPISIESVATVLESLPDPAWPYGLVVAVQDNLPSETERLRIRGNLDPLLGDLGVLVGFRPDADAPVHRKTLLTISSSARSCIDPQAYIGFH